MTDSPESTHVTVTRRLPSPCRTVYAALTTPEDLSAWFTPRRYLAPIDQIHVEARPGGHWELAMVDPETAEHFHLVTRLEAAAEPHELVGSTTSLTRFGQFEHVALSVRLADDGEACVLQLDQGPLDGPDQAKAVTDAWTDALSRLEDRLRGAEPEPVGVPPGAQGDLGLAEQVAPAEPGPPVHQGKRRTGHLRRSRKSLR